MKSKCCNADILFKIVGSLTGEMEVPYCWGCKTEHPCETIPDDKAEPDLKGLHKNLLAMQEQIVAGKGGEKC